MLYHAITSFFVGLPSPSKWFSMLVVVVTSPLLIIFVLTPYFCRVSLVASEAAGSLLSVMVFLGDAHIL